MNKKVQNWQTDGHSIIYRIFLGEKISKYQETLSFMKAETTPFLLSIQDRRTNNVCNIADALRSEELFNNNKIAVYLN